MTECIDKCAFLVHYISVKHYLMDGHGTYDSTLLGDKMQFGTYASSPIICHNPEGRSSVKYIPL